jgi:hypothetical protein
MSGLDEMTLPPCSRCGAKTPWYSAFDKKGGCLVDMTSERVRVYEDTIEDLPAEFEVDNESWATYTKNNWKEGIEEIRVVCCENCNANYTSQDVEYSKFITVIKKHLREWTEDS